MSYGALRKREAVKLELMGSSQFNSRLDINASGFNRNNQTAGNFRKKKKLVLFLHNWMTEITRVAEIRNSQK